MSFPVHVRPRHDGPPNSDDLRKIISLIPTTYAKIVVTAHSLFCCHINFVGLDLCKHIIRKVRADTSHYFYHALSASVQRKNAEEIEKKHAVH
jgi:hypothetical protein